MALLADIQIQDGKVIDTCGHNFIFGDTNSNVITGVADPNGGFNGIHCEYAHSLLSSDIFDSNKTIVSVSFVFKNLAAAPITFFSIGTVGGISYGDSINYVNGYLGIGHASNQTKLTNDVSRMKFDKTKLWKKFKACFDYGNKKVRIQINGVEILEDNFASFEYPGGPNSGYTLIFSNWVHGENRYSNGTFMNFYKIKVFDSDVFEYDDDYLFGPLRYMDGETPPTNMIRQY